MILNGLWYILAPKQAQESPKIPKKPERPVTGPGDPKQPVARQAAHPVSSMSLQGCVVQGLFDYFGC